MNRRRFRVSALLAAAFILLAACSSDPVDNNGDDPRQSPNQTTSDASVSGDADTAEDTAHTNGDDADAGTEDADTGPDDNDDNDENDDNGTVSECEAELDPDAAFQIPADSSAYYARTAFAGDSIWVVYTTSVDIGGEEVEKAHLARYGCDGELQGDPKMIGADGDDRDIETAVAADEDTVYAVWVQEAPGGQQIMGRSWESDATPLQDEPFRVTAQLKNDETVGTIWKPELAVDDDGNAVLVVEALTTADPRVILQRFSPEGNAILGGFYVHDSDEHGGQHAPAVTVLDDGTIHFAYLGGPINQGSVYQGSVQPDGESAAESPVPVENDEPISQSVRYAPPTDTASGWMVYPRASEPGNPVIFRPSSDLDGSSVAGSVSLSGRTSIYADVATGESGGGALAWMSYPGAGPTEGRIHFQSFDAQPDGSQINVGSRVDQHDDEDAAWPYGPSITRLLDDTYAAVWTEDHDGLEVHGRILEF